MGRWVFGLGLYAAAWFNLVYLIALGGSETSNGRVWDGLGHLVFGFLLWGLTMAASRGMGFRGPLPRLRRKRRA